MQKLNELVNELNLLVSQFRFEEALNKFYSNDLVSAENENPPIIGLPAYRIAAKKYIENVSNYKAELKNVIISDNLSACEWHYTFDHKEWGKWDRIQLSVQRWKDGRIVHERHYYAMD